MGRGCPLPLGAAEESPAPSSFLPQEGFTHTDETPPSRLVSRLSSPGSPSLSPKERCSSPFIIIATLHWPYSSTSLSLPRRGAQHRTQHPEVSQQSGAEGQGLLSQPALGALPSAAQGLVAPSHKGTCLALAQVASHQDHQDLRPGAALQQVPMPGLVPLQGQDLVSPWLNSMRFLCSFPQPAPIPLDDSTTLRRVTAPSSGPPVSWPRVLPPSTQLADEDIQRHRPAR